VLAVQGVCSLPWQVVRTSVRRLAPLALLALLAALTIPGRSAS